MKAKELRAILEAHGKYLRGENGGAKAYLRQADLTSADLNGDDLSYADLQCAVLCGANLYQADLHEANLLNAYLRGANLCEAKLRNADLRGANLRNANLRDADLSGAELYEADLRGADLRGADLRAADLRETGVIRIQADYEVTLYPGEPEPVLAYGCESHVLSHWHREVETITLKHENYQDKDHVARRVAEIRTILALCGLVRAQPARREGER